MQRTMARFGLAGWIHNASFWEEMTCSWNAASCATALPLSEDASLQRNTHLPHWHYASTAPGDATVHLCFIHISYFYLLIAYLQLGSVKIRDAHCQYRPIFFFWIGLDWKQTNIVFLIILLFVSIDLWEFCCVATCFCYVVLIPLCCGLFPVVWESLIVLWLKKIKKFPRCVATCFCWVVACFSVFFVRISLWLVSVVLQLFSAVLQLVCIVLC